MHPYTSVLFDLDGTISRSAPGITTSLAKGLAAVGIKAEPASLTRFVGPPLNVELARVYGLSPEEIARVLLAFRERYESVGLYETELYPGIAALIGDLAAAGIALAVASSKPEPHVRRLMDWFGLAEKFTVISGSSFEAEMQNKAGANDKELVIRRVLSRLAEKSPEAVRRPVMIGDTRFDILGAKANGIDAIAVTYGYGKEADLLAASPTHLAKDTEELRRYLLCE